ncbi:hypothetical protein AGMMS50239_16480 [Bacteroidia bacterium]|nr:hypothetical protein AGMMS50239_16480 [Bacteroidia bacterium]
MKLNIDETNNSLDIELVMNTAPHYLLSETRSLEIKSEVLNAVVNWKNVAVKYKISPSEITRKMRAFSKSTYT